MLTISGDTVVETDIWGRSLDPWFERELMSEQTSQPGLPPAASLTIGAAFTAGLGTLAFAVRAWRDGLGMDRMTLVTLVVLTSLVVASWIWPLVMYHESESEAVHLDEAAWYRSPATRAAEALAS